MCLELLLKEAEGCFGWRSLSATSRLWKMEIVKEEGTRVDDKGGREYGETWDVPTAGDVGIRLLILSSEVFDSVKSLFTSGPNWSGAGAFEVYLWVERTLSVEFELSGGEEGLVGGEEPVVEVDEDDSITTGNTVVRGPE